MANCTKCGNRLVTMTGTIYATPDAEPYESGVEEEKDLNVEFGVYFEYCEECETTDLIHTS